MKHFHDYIDGWFDFGDFYAEVVNSHDKENGVFVEVGAWLGKSLSCLGVEVINSKKNIKIYSVDTWKGSEEHKTVDGCRSYEVFNAVKNDTLFDMFWKNIDPIKDVVTPIKLSSVEAAKTFEDNSIDFIFLDASHKYSDVRNDLNAWYPKIKKGGIFAGHDYGWDEVRAALEEFGSINNITIYPKSTSSWMFTV